jgi:hypothetical protein
MANKTATWLGVALAAVLAGCASYEPVPLEDVESTRAQKPLGGATLAEKRSEMERTQQDMVRHLRTLDAMLRRDDKDGVVLFKNFFYGYMDDHVTPLLARSWTSHHPELGGLDASIRFFAIETLAKLNAPHRAKLLIKDLKARFQGRGDLMVDYPIGRRSNVTKALELVEEQYWRDKDPNARLNADMPEEDEWEE